MNSASPVLPLYFTRARLYDEVLEVEIWTLSLAFNVEGPWNLHPRGKPRIVRGVEMLADVFIGQGKRSRRTHLVLTKSVLDPLTMASLGAWACSHTR